MKIKNKILIMILLFIMSLAVSNNANAAIVVKYGELNYGNFGNVSNAYQLCYDMGGNSDSTLGNNKLDPHLMLNREWAAVEFLTASTYGNANNSSDFYSVQIGSNTMKYFTSNRNFSGVFYQQINVYGITEFTSSLYDQYNGTSNQYMEKIVNNKNTKYVDLISLPYDISTGATRYQGNSNLTNDAPILAINAATNFNGERKPLNGGGVGYTGAFRPVIWNIAR